MFVSVAEISLMVSYHYVLFLSCVDLDLRVLVLSHG